MTPTIPNLLLWSKQPFSNSNGLIQVEVIVNENFQTILLQELESLLAPLVKAAQSQTQRRQLLADLGWDLDAIAGMPIGELERAIQSCVNTWEQLKPLLASPPDSLDALKPVFKQAGTLFQTIRQVTALLKQAQVDVPAEILADLERLGTDLIEWLTLHYLQHQHPALYQLGVLLTLIESSQETKAAVQDPKSGEMIRFPVPRSQLQLQRLSTLLTRPDRIWQEAYWGPDALQTRAGAKAVADRLFPRLAGLLQTLGVEALYGIKPMYGLDFGEAGNDLMAGMLTVEMPFLVDQTGMAIEAGMTLALSSAEDGDLGLVVLPFGALEVDQTWNDWDLMLKLAGSVGGFAIGRHGLTLLTEGAQQVEAQLSANRLANASNQALVIGGSNSTRLEVDRLQVQLWADLNHQEQDYGFLLEAGSAAFVVSAQDGDGFLQAILPPEGLQIPFNLALGWSKRKGLFFRGGGGLEALLPVKLSVFDVLTLDSLYLALRTQGEDVQAIAAATATVKLGPVTAIVEQMGLEATLSFPETGGNLGVADLALDFKPPAGAGLAVDAGIVVGGGYLFFDPDKEQYAGAMLLEFGGTIALKAVGLLTTRLPDGSKGFSLLVIISAEGFAPIQLGFGFTLNGVGGLLGINRTANVEALRAGLRNGALDAILFPSDPVRHASQLIQTLNTVFPAAPDRYLFGPMAKIGWGTPTILTIDLGLILELPSPVRLLVLGRLKACLPDQDHPLVKIQMDALGVIDFDRGELALDATLYDSRILQFTLTGDMALRANWGQEPSLLMAIGGFHPRFRPPQNFPKLSRIAIALAAGDNPRLRLEAYLALTSNTVQFGARLDLYAAAGNFNITGYLSFDALFQFSPFHFIVDMAAMVALRYKQRSLMSLQIEVMLSGPAPWHVRGKVSFEVLFFKGTISFDQTFGAAAPPALPPAIDVESDLRTALADRRNWSTQLPTSEHPLVTLRESESSDALLLHPLGGLVVRQRLLPLDHILTKFGNVSLSEAQQFNITGVQLGDRWLDEADITPLQDYFALAQFEEMSDDAKLRLPSFMQAQAGIQIGAQELRYGRPLDVPLAYEETQVMSIPNEAKSVTVAARAPIDAALLEAQIAVAAVSQSPMRHTGVEKYREPTLTHAFALREPL